MWRVISCRTLASSDVHAPDRASEYVMYLPRSSSFINRSTAAQPDRSCSFIIKRSRSRRGRGLQRHYLSVFALIVQRRQSLARCKLHVEAKPARFTTINKKIILLMCMTNSQSSEVTSNKTQAASTLDKFNGIPKYLDK